MSDLSVKNWLTPLAIRTHLYTVESLAVLEVITRNQTTAEAIESLHFLQPDISLGTGEQNKAVLFCRDGDIDWERWIRDSQARGDHQESLAEKFLTAIFQNLRGYNVVPEIIVRTTTNPGDDVVAGHLRYRRERRHPHYKDEDSDRPMIYASRLCDLAAYHVSCAIADSELPVKTFSFQHLHDPSLQVYDLPESYDPNRFYNALNSMRSLSSIWLWFDGDNTADDPVLDAFFSALPPGCLKNIGLWDVSASVSSLVAFLRDSGRNLETIHLLDVGLSTEGLRQSEDDWKTVLLTVSELPRLVRLHLKGIYVGEDLVCDSETNSEWLLEADPIRRGGNESSATRATDSPNTTSNMIEQVIDMFQKRRGFVSKRPE